jgi:hypothetical protein
MLTHEDVVRIAREAVGGIHRPSAECEGTYTQPWGETVTVSIACEHSVTNPASYDPPVLEAMQRAYRRGRQDESQAVMARSCA